MAKARPCVTLPLRILKSENHFRGVASFSDGEEILGCLLVQRKVPTAALKVPGFRAKFKVYRAWVSVLGVNL